MYIELCTKYKFAQRLEYLMNAVIEGKGFSKLRYIDGAEGFGGDGEYAQENEAAAVEDSEDANNATDSGAAPSFSFSEEHTVEGKASNTDQVEGDTHQEKPTQPFPNMTPQPSPQHPAYRSTKITSTSDSQGERTPRRDSTQEQSKEINTKYADQVPAEDDIIDFSDEEVIPEVSARSSTLQGDDGFDENKRDSPENRHDAEELIDYGDGEELSTEMHSADPLFHNSNPEQSLNEGVAHITGDSQEDKVPHKQSLDEVDDLDHIVDYGGEDFQGGGTYQEYGDGILEDETALDLVNDTAQTGDSEQVKSVTETKQHPAQTLNYDIDFGDDLEEEVGDVAEAVTLGSPHTAPHKDNHTVDLVDFNVKDNIGALNGQGTQREKNSHTLKTSQDHKGLNNDAEDFLLDSDDEITFSDQIKPVPKSATTPPSLKRLRDSREEEIVPRSTSPGGSHADPTI